MGRRVLLAGGLAAALMAASRAGGACRDGLLLVVRERRPAPTWESTAETDSHGNKKMSGVTGSSSPGIPGNIRDKVVAVTASAENPPGETAERRQRRRRQQQVAGVRADRLGAATSSPSPVDGRRLRAHLGQRRRRARPARLGAPGLARRQRLDDARHADRPGLRRALPDQASTTSPTPRRYELLPARTSPPTTAATSSSSPSSSSPTATPTPPPADRHEARSSTAGPVSGPTMQAERRLDRRARRCSYAGGHTADGRGYAYDKVFDVDVDGHARTPSCRT